jgi:glutaconate CoA-transferase, subunit A
MRPKPLVAMAEAVESTVTDGAEVLFGGFAYSDPFAAAHEMIRQGRRDLRVLKSSGGVLVDQLIAAGCIRQLVSCHVWNSVGPEPAHAFRRALETANPELEIEEMSFGAFTGALMAAAANLPFMPTTPNQGTGQFQHRSFMPDKFAVVASPFDGSPVTVVKPLTVDVGFFHVHRVDEFGNAQAAGPTAELRYAAGACKRVVVVTEEIVDTSEIRARPELTVIPGFHVDAIVVEPWAAHPGDSYGYYWRDLAHHNLYARLSQTREGLRSYLDEWVYGLPNRRAYIEKLGDTTLQELMVRGSKWW